MNRRVPPPEEQVGWQKELDELAERKRIAQEMGGKERVERQHAGGRLTVRERIDKVLDTGSFHELGSVAGKAKYDKQGNMVDFMPGNGVFGRGKIDGRPVVVFGDDFTVRGGSADASIRAKYQMPEQMAAEFRMPIIRMIEGSGGGGSVKTIETKGYANLPGGIAVSSGLHLCAQNMGLVPVVAMGLGSVAGLGAARLSASHYSLMVKDMSAVFVAGPPVVDRLGEKRTKQELGGHKVQIAAGTVDDAVDTEEEAFARARKFLSYLPSSIWDLPPRIQTWDDPNRRDESLLNIVPRDRKKAYQMRKIIDLVVDKGSFFEIARGFGRAIITGFARLDGWPVGILAGDPLHEGGAWNATASRKITKFVDTCQTFHLPVVHLVDCFGFAVGLAAESTGTMRFARAGGQRDPPEHGAVVRHDRAQRVRRRRRRACAAHPRAVPLLLAVGQLGFAAAGRRRRGGLPRRDRCRGRSCRQARRDRGAAGTVALAIPHRRGVPGGRDHRPA